MAGRSTGKCPDCMREYEREKSARRRATNPTARARDRAAWQHARNLARARDGGCIHRNTGTCNGELSVHHVLPLNLGGTHELANLVTLCRRHHEDHERGFLSDGSHTHLAGFRETHSGERDSSAEDSEGPSIG